MWTQKTTFKNVKHKKIKFNAIFSKKKRNSPFIKSVFVLNRKFVFQKRLVRVVHGLKINSFAVR